MTEKEALEAEEHIKLLSKIFRPSSKKKKKKGKK